MRLLRKVELSDF